MRSQNTFVIAVLVLTVIFVPLFAVKENKEKTAKPTAAVYIKDTESTASVALKSASEQKVRVLENGKVTVLPLTDYIYGVVAGEIPLSYNEEALKAQIVAAKTYTLYRIEHSANSDYDVTTDSDTSQNYITRKKALENWGENATKYDEKLKKAITEVMDYTITYKNKPIQAVYHAISAGRTESGKNVWGNEVAYLQPAESVGDKLAEDYLSESAVAKETANRLLKNSGFTVADLCNGKCTKSESGNVIKITYKDKSITGGEICRIFSLRSQNFDFKQTNGKLIFTVRGYGHQAGMSQNGANYMAKCGSTFKEILRHYYKGVKIEKDAV